MTRVRGQAFIRCVPFDTSIVRRRLSQRARTVPSPRYGEHSHPPLGDPSPGAPSPTRQRTQTCIPLSGKILSAIWSLFAKVSFENEPQRRKSQIRGGIRLKNRQN